MKDKIRRITDQPVPHKPRHGLEFCSHMLVYQFTLGSLMLKVTDMPFLLLVQVFTVALADDVRLAKLAPLPDEPILR